MNRQCLFSAAGIDAVVDHRRLRPGEVELYCGSVSTLWQAVVMCPKPAITVSALMSLKPDPHDSLVVTQSHMPLDDSPTPTCVVARSLYLFVLGWASGGTGLYR